MLKLGYLGPEGTFSHEAAEKWNDGQYDLVPFRTISAVLDALRQGQAARVIVPFENLLGGEVVETADYLIAHIKEGGNLKITGELLLPIQHMLLGKRGLEFGKIRRVISHPQALAQCQNYLGKYEWEVVEVASTAKAAEMVASSDGLDTAAISSLKASEMYKLELLASDIGDNNQNVTRFIFLGGPVPVPTGNDRTTIIFTTPDKPGALHEALGPFYYLGVNLSKIYSRTLKRILGECVFWLDAEGHLKDDNRVLNNAIGVLEKSFATKLWIAGSYSKAEE